MSQTEDWERKKSLWKVGEAEEMSDFCFISSQCPDGRRLEGLSKQLDWDVRKIQRWFRHRRNQDKPTILTKFCESM